MVDSVNEKSEAYHPAGCSCCNGHHRGAAEEISRRSFVKVVGTTAIGAVALSGLSWSALSAVQTGSKNIRERKPLRVKPVFTHEIPVRREQTSWRAWGGIQTEADVTSEIAKIQEELDTLKLKADFPVEFMPVAKVRKSADLAGITDLQEADLFLVYAAGGGMDIFDTLNKTGKNIILDRKSVV